ncbi:MAG TPA: aminotransferase class V-fold PLP-dependent enzyme [Bryobacteraceae bacterium]|nr:aminotransferase class V-fold PLP-dependent enzyme [Bryobacteraceae bacterium]
MTYTLVPNRRQLFSAAGRSLLAGVMARLPIRGAARTEGNIYQRIGVEPIINCKGTFTIISGSQTLPEVKKALDEASRHYVHLDELMEGVGRRLAELTRAEWGIITAGCAAALTHATSACIAGANPEKMQRLPKLAGLKHEVVMPKASRNVYDHAIRMTGVTMITPSTREEFMAALRPSTAMVALLGEAMDRHPMKVEEIAQAAHAHGIPVLVDAAAERLTIPNVYLKAGADMVAYSGGKCLRGPQCAGVLLGRKDLLQAAWINSAPHHAFGRSLKVGKEEIMGMLAAVEAWTKRNHDAEWKQWEGWLGVIRDKVSSIPTVQTEVLQPRGPSNFAPQLRISWDTKKLGVTGTELSDALLAGTPRILIPSAAESVTIMPYMMMPGDAETVAPRLRELLSKPPKRPAAPAAGGTAQAGGQWDVEISYLRDQVTHSVFFEQNGDKLRGSHRGEFLQADLSGSLEGSTARWRSNHHYEGTSIGYSFEGTLDGDSMRGTVDVGEYGKAPFTARRHFHA